MRLKRAAIIGVGLMGASLGAALRRARPRWHVTGIGRRPKALAEARRRGFIDEATTDGPAGVKDADVVVVATPVDAIVPFLMKIRPHLPSGALVMDVGSVKEAIAVPASRIFKGGGPFFVGAHPMAGSEKTGFEWARADLYRNAACILTPDRGADSKVLARARHFWRSVGARVHEMSAAEHDRWLAAISHLPHLLAHALILSSLKGGGAAKTIAALAAGSFRDATRVAGADPAQWRSIFKMNRKNLADASRGLSKTLEELMKKEFPMSSLRRSRAFRAGLDQ